MFDKHKEAQSTSLADIQQEVKSLKSLLARRTEAPTASSSSSLPTSVSTPTLHQPQPANSSSSSYTSPYISPYASAGGNRFGMGSSQTYGGRESPSLASIANRPPGIPAWQLPQNNQPSASAAETQASSAASSVAGTTQVNGDSNADAAKQDTAESSKTDGKDMAESGEIVDASEITA